MDKLKYLNTGILNNRERERQIYFMYKYNITEIWCENSGQKIYGVAYMPEVDGKVPLVIYAHELCHTHEAGSGYARELASYGIAVYTFDFRGGSYDSKSDGKTTEMSVMTGVSDLEAVIADAKIWDFVDTDKIYLLGGSQGGMSAAVMAERHPEVVAGLMLLYPAFVIPDVVHDQFHSLKNVPEQFDWMGWIMVGKNYASDVWDYDPYRQMKNYPGPVLILHGDRDMLVDISYSQKAAEHYPNVSLHMIEGAGHIFSGPSFQLAVEFILNFLQTELGI